ncbi:MAG: hypothetical protein J3K34DRAFT_464578 [Monoraphidium minutum]|nr:MAG: hypothetical protein J3K34DRAFT_464578 [Monoraphidium minutum]
MARSKPGPQPKKSPGQLADEEVLRRPTFGPGSLKHVSAAGCLPSTLGPRERVLLAKDPLLRVELGRIYQGEANTIMPVWDRLCADAAVRASLPLRQERAAPPAAPAAPPQPAARGAECGAHSGFVVNNASGAAAAQEQRLREAAAAAAPALGALHLITLKSFKKARRPGGKFPIDFFAAARPRAQTTNQTLRMVGLYEEDGFMMARMGALPLVGVLPGAYLPDIRRR